MEYKEFAKLVDEMRGLQKAYFKESNKEKKKEFLIRSKAAEKKVDLAIGVVLHSLFPI